MSFLLPSKTLIYGKPHNGLELPSGNLLHSYILEMAHLVCLPITVPMVIVQSVLYVYQRATSF